MKFRGRARSRLARGKCLKAPRKTDEVPQNNAERPDTTPNDNETDTAPPCLPFASWSIARLPLFRRATFVAPAAAMVPTTQGTLNSTSETMYMATNFRLCQRGGGAVDLSLISDLGEVDLSPISG